MEPNTQSIFMFHLVRHCLKTVLSVHTPTHMFMTHSKVHTSSDCCGTVRFVSSCYRRLYESITAVQLQAVARWCLKRTSCDRSRCFLKMVASGNLGVNQNIGVYLSFSHLHHNSIIVMVLVPEGQSLFVCCHKDRCPLLNKQHVLFVHLTK